MPRMFLGAKNLGFLSDGYTEKMIDKAIEEVTEDLNSRGEDGIAREITIKISFVPDGKVIAIVPTISVKKPPQKAFATQAKLNDAGGGLLFNPEVSANLDQQTFSDIASNRHGELPPAE